MVAGKQTSLQYRYTVDLIYLDNVNNKQKELRRINITSIVIDHNFEQNHMPVIYVTISLDKSLIDDMVLNINKNLIILGLYRYDNLSDQKTEERVFRKKCVYFLPNNVNKMDSADYNEDNEEQNRGETLQSITMGLLILDHINQNKRSLELSMKNNTVYDAAKYCLDGMTNTVIEKFSYADELDRLIMPTKDSVKKALEFLNNYRVFYSTPYRYYQDFDNTYLISSSGKAIPKAGEKYSKVMINILDFEDPEANDIGMIDNQTASTFCVPLSYNATQVYDNSIVNKSKNNIKGITSSGSKSKKLRNTAEYSSDKTQTIRLDNDNENMIKNLQAKDNANNFIIYFNKNDLDTNLFTINKQITIHNIDKYKKFNGTYLLRRKREIYIREDETFLCSSMITLSKILKESELTEEESS